MAATGAGTTVGVVMGALICLGLILVTIAATIVLSLISIYNPNKSQQGYGDAYRINYLMLKSMYTNTSYTFYNSTMADNTQLSTACTNTYVNSGEQNVAGCLVSNNRAYGPGNTSTNSRRRRRQTANVGLYTIGQATIYYSTPCSRKADIGKYANNSDLSYCVSKRLAACNRLFNNSLTTFVQWFLPSPITYAVVDITFSGYISLIVSQIFAIRATTEVILATTIGLNSSTLNQIPYGCQYLGPISQSAIAAAIAAQALETTTAPSSTPFSG